jgi:hypothetical protein
VEGRSIDEGALGLFEKEEVKEKREEGREINTF